MNDRSAEVLPPLACASEAWPRLQRARRAIVVVDIVESVRLVQQNESDVIEFWRRFIEEVRTLILPPYGGRLAKSLGDGLLLEFPDVRPAVLAAMDLQRRIGRHNEPREQASRVHLRAGVHVADVIVDDLDIFGSGVSHATRLASLANPGDVVVSAEVRDSLADGHDCRLVDLGECYLKHYSSTVRAFRASPLDSQENRLFSVLPLDALPSLAVVPFAAYLPADQATALGDAIADDVISALSQQRIRVISRLSSGVFRGAPGDLQKIRSLLGVAYVVTGSFRTAGSQVRVRVELTDAANGSVLWTDHLTAELTDIFIGQDSIVGTIASQIGREVIRAEVNRARHLPISNLDGYTLYIASVHMLHRLARDDFSRARILLESLCDRYPRSAAPLAMLAKWHVLRIAQGWVDDVQAAGREAQYYARRALNLDPSEALALAMDGMMAAQVDHDLERARVGGEAATQANPQEPDAWLVLGGVSSYLGNSALAEALPMRAIQLSPLDPARYLFDAFLAAGKISAGKFEEAAAAARSSIRSNAMHPVSHRLLTTALALAGKGDEARAAAQDLMRIAPNFRVSKFADRHPGRDLPLAADLTRALLEAGVPA